MPDAASFRTRILLIVLLVALVPLGIVGLWLTRSTARSGEELLRTRIAEALDATVAQIIASWIDRRSVILDLAEHPVARATLDQSAPGGVPEQLAERADRLEPWVVSVRLRDLEGREYTLVDRRGTATDPTSAFEIEEPAFTVRVAVWEGMSDIRLGAVEARLAADAILPMTAIPPEAAGMVLGILDTASGQLLRPVPFDPGVLGEKAFRWGGERWLTGRNSLVEPPVTLVIAAPLTPFTVPFETAARRGTWILGAVTLVGLVLAGALTGRLTESLERLSDAAQAVARGDLKRRVDVSKRDEVGRVAEAFNSMSESLETTLAQLANQRSLAAVGQFAASLAHEVRNPLTAIRVDLQRVQDGLSDPSLRKPQERALNEIVRLNETVERTLRRARSGGLESATVDLNVPVQAAVAAASPAFEEAGARLTFEPLAEAAEIEGDTGALEQLFLNLLQNAARALSSGGEARVGMTIDDGRVVVSVEDDGVGIPENLQERVFDPLFTTSAEGTGLGLAIARRIATAHGAELDLTSVSGEGTVVSVRFPRDAKGEPADHGYLET